MKNTNKKAFTLIELLIVIAIVGILAAIVLAVINPQRQRQRAQEAVGRSTASKACAAIAACNNASSNGVCANPQNELLNSIDSVNYLSFNNINADSVQVVVNGSVGNCTITCTVATGSLAYSTGCIVD